MCCLYADLKAFERRLTDVISQCQPVAVRWRGIFISAKMLFVFDWNIYQCTNFGRIEVYSRVVSFLLKIF